MLDISHDILAVSVPSTLSCTWKNFFLKLFYLLVACQHIRVRSTVLSLDLKLNRDVAPDFIFK